VLLGRIVDAHSSGGRSLSAELAGAQLNGSSESRSDKHYGGNTKGFMTDEIKLIVLWGKQNEKTTNSFFSYVIM